MKPTSLTIKPKPLAFFEISTLGAAMVIADHIDKSAGLTLLQAELNDYYGYVLKFTGNSAALRMAEQTTLSLAKQMHAPCQCCLIDAPDAKAWLIIYSCQNLSAVGRKQCKNVFSASE